MHRWQCSCHREEDLRKCLLNSVVGSPLGPSRGNPPACGNQEYRPRTLLQFKSLFQILWESFEGCWEGGRSKFLHLLSHFQWFNICHEVNNQCEVEVWDSDVLNLVPINKPLDKRVEIAQISLKVVDQGSQKSLPIMHGEEQHHRHIHNTLEKRQSNSMPQHVQGLNTLFSLTPFSHSVTEANVAFVGDLLFQLTSCGCCWMTLARNASASAVWGSRCIRCQRGIIQWCVNRAEKRFLAQRGGSCSFWF